MRARKTFIPGKIFLLSVAVALSAAAGASAPNDAPQLKPKPGGGVVCGGIQGPKCPQSDQVCDLPAGKCSGADMKGTCVTRPEVCADQLAPVCGCDAKTYGNDCERLRAGAQKDHDGECATAEPK